MTHDAPIFLSNTLGRRLERFEALDAPRVLIYTCGPTVYNYIHIGNFRSFILADTLRRMLEYNRYEVVHARNITDVGHLTDETLNVGLDRIEKAAREKHQTPEDIVRYYTGIFLRDAERLNLLAPHFLPRASEYVQCMIRMTEQLVSSRHAYPANGDVYFDVSSYPSYGELSGNSIEDLVAGARVEVGEGKRSPADFALWRGADPDKLVRFDSPWGPGVPGWHIECSAMSRELLADQIDIHTGGIDNIFPHHEDERAQSEAASGKPFVRYWVHSEWLQLAKGEKMSKSAGNVFTVQDLVDDGFHPLAFRYFTFQAHYRTPLSFTWDALGAAQTALVRIWEATAELAQTSEREALSDEAQPYRSRFQAAINRDLDMPVALSVVHDVLGTRLPAAQKLTLLGDFDSVLGLRILEMARRLSMLSIEERALLDQRDVARRNKNWTSSDELRYRLSVGGLEVKDTPHGQRWVRKDAVSDQSGPSE